MKTLTTILIILLVLASCKSEVQGSTESSSEVQCLMESSNEESHPEILGFENIPSQEFLISSDTDTILVGANGTKVKIESGIFVDSTGKEVHGNVRIELKECLDIYSMVLGGLTTTSNGEILESGGMICLNANFQNQKLSLKRNSTIQIEVPADSIIKGMQYFEGVSNGGKINWVNPVPLAIKKPDAENFKRNSDSIQINYITDTIYKRHNVGYNVDINGEKVVGNKIPIEIKNKISNFIFAENGLVIKKDSTILIDGYKINLYKNDDFNTWKDYKYGKKWVSSSSINSFQEDANNSYVFNIKKLGWANIDRFFNDPRTKEIDWFASINDREVYSNTYVSLVFENQKI